MAKVCPFSNIAGYNAKGAHLSYQLQKRRAPLAYTPSKEYKVQG